MSNAQSKTRATITKSRSGHYTVTVRSADGAVLLIKDKLPDLANARAEIAKVNGTT